MRLHSTLSLACLAALGTTITDDANAQTFTSSPAGFETTPGPSGGVRPFFGGAYRNQIVDGTNTGAGLMNIIALNFRRDEQAGAVSGAVARTADVTINMGHGSTETFQNSWDDNYASPSTNVFTTKTVNLPDLTAQTAGGGAEPWSIRFPFDTPFSYNGVDDLVHETIYANPSATGSYRLDRASSTGSLAAVGFGSGVLGSGCTATGAAGPMSTTSILYGHNGQQIMRFGWEVSNAPANQAVLFNFAASNAMLTLPGVCGTLVATPDVSVPLGVADGSGDIGRSYFSFPYNALLTATNVFGQAVALDPGSTNAIPVVLDQGHDMIWPTGGAPATDFAFIYSSDPGASQGAGPITFIGPIITGLEQ